MQDSHSCDPGSIPGRRIELLFQYVIFLTSRKLLNINRTVNFIYAQDISFSEPFHLNTNTRNYNSQNLHPRKCVPLFAGLKMFSAVFYFR